MIYVWKYLPVREQRPSYEEELEERIKKGNEEYLLTGESEDDLLDRMELKERLQRLTPREQWVLSERFFADMTLEEVGEGMGCTGENIRQIELKAVEKLRKDRQRNSTKKLEPKKKPDATALLYAAAQKDPAFVGYLMNQLVRIVSPREYPLWVRGRTIAKKWREGKAIQGVNKRTIEEIVAQLHLTPRIISLYQEIYQRGAYTKPEPRPATPSAQEHFPPQSVPAQEPISIPRAAPAQQRVTVPLPVTSRVSPVPQRPSQSVPETKTLDEKVQENADLFNRMYDACYSLLTAACYLAGARGLQYDLSNEQPNLWYLGLDFICLGIGVALSGLFFSEKYLNIKEEMLYDLSELRKKIKQ